MIVSDQWEQCCSVTKIDFDCLKNKYILEIERLLCVQRMIAYISKSMIRFSL